MSSRFPTPSSCVCFPTMAGPGTPGALRKALVRMSLRALAGTVAQPYTPLALQRLAMDNAALAMRSPRGLHSEQTRLGNIPSRRLQPAKARTDRHLLYLHGGAYILGSSRSHTPLAGQLAHAAGAIAWLIDYRLAPEHPYPAAVDDTVAAYRTLLDQGHSNITLAGDSAGGGLALAATLAIRDAGLPMPAALVLLSPWTDLTLSGASMARKHRDDPMLSPLWLEQAAGFYAGNTPRTAPGISPVFADFAGFPPIRVHVGSEEVLLDDATFLGERARQSGIDAGVRVFDGLWHVFQAQAGLLAEADESLQELGEFIRSRR